MQESITVYHISIHHNGIALKQLQKSSELLFAALETTCVIKEMPTFCVLVVYKCVLLIHNIFWKIA
jgi:hypothetical protein